MKNGTIKVKFSNGFGNNMFQYCFGRLLAEYHNLNFSHDAIPELNIKKEDYKFKKEWKTVKFKASSNREAKIYDRNHIQWFSDKYKKHNFDFYSFMFYFEDYSLYTPHVDRIRKWFPEVKKTNYDDLVLHFRLKNRLVWETHYKNFIKPSSYRDMIKSNFKFKKLYIVTDMDIWKHVDEKYIKKLHNEVKIKYKSNPTKFISLSKSIKYMNELVDNLKEFKPILHNSKKFIDDFNFIRSFDQIMFKNSTFAWWASFLSNASKVSPFKLWKPGKGKKKNRNLGKVDLLGWFGWGEMDDLLNKKAVINASS